MFAFTLLLAAVITHAPTHSPKPLDSKLAIAVQRLIKLQEGVGGAVGVVRDGHLIYAQGFGMRNLAQRQPVNAATRFEVGSITKQFTAAALLQLKEQKKLSLDDPLARYLPSFPHAREITLRQLLNQVSGLQDYAKTKNFDETMSAKPGGIEAIASYAKGPLDFKPGTDWEYSSTNYFVLGRVIETVSHVSYEEYVRRHLFAPAGMINSAFVQDEPKLDNFATPYWLGPNGAGPRRPAPLMPESWVGAAGGIVSTLGDLASWDAALADGKIVSHNDFVMMTSPGRLANGHPYDYGMGFSIDALDGHKRIWHDGSTTGSVAVTAIYPKDRIGIIVLENSMTGNPFAIESVVLEAMFPDALAFARRPAPGEDTSKRPRLVKLIKQILNGTIQASELTPEFQKFLMPRRAKIGAYFSAFGPPRAEIFKGKYDRADAIWYVYRVEFTNTVRNCTIKIDKKTNLVSSVGIQPPS